MANRFSIVILSSSKEMAKRLHSSLPSISVLRSNSNICFSTACPHAQGSDPVVSKASSSEVNEAKNMTVETAWDAAKKASQNITETTTAEADTNVVDTVEYRSTEDLKGQLGDGCDKIEL